MGDIIKIRMFLEKHSELETSLSSTESEDLHVSITSADLMPKEVSFPVETSPKEAMEKKDDNAGASISPCTSYSAQDMLKKRLARTKCTRAQTFFNNLLRDCARASRIWQKAYPLPSIPDAKMQKFYELVLAAAPQLAGHKSEIRVRLGQALQNRRKYENDVKIGKRKRKNGNESTVVSTKENMVVASQKTIVDHLQGQKQPSLSSQIEHSSPVVADDDDVCGSDKNQMLPFKQGDDVIVYKEKERQNKLAKATYLGPKDSKDGMYSLLQLKNKFLPDDDEIPLPEKTCDGDTTLNELMEKTIFVWKSAKLGAAGSSNGPAKKKIKTSKEPSKKTVGNDSKEHEPKEPNKPEDSASFKEMIAPFKDGITSAPVKAHDGAALRIGQWVAAAYNKKFYVGQIAAFEEGDVSINFLARKKPGEYRWPKQPDVGTFHPHFVFFSQARVQKVGTIHVVSNEEQIVNNFESYRKKYL